MPWGRVAKCQQIENLSQKLLECDTVRFGSVRFGFRFSVQAAAALNILELKGISTLL